MHQNPCGRTDTTAKLIFSDRYQRPVHSPVADDPKKQKKENNIGDEPIARFILPQFLPRFRFSPKKKKKSADPLGDGPHRRLSRPSAAAASSTCTASLSLSRRLLQVKP